MKLFDDVSRTDHGPRPYGMHEFAYLNTSARPGVEAIRKTIEQWFSRYPDHDKKDLRAQFRSDDHQHRAAYFELFLHELLLRLGCTVEVHPAVPNTATRPDFLVTDKTAKKFYLEATLATDMTQDEMAAEARKNTVYDALNKLDSPNFYVGMDLYGSPATSPSGKKMRIFLSQKLASLDRDEIAELLDKGGFSAVPRWTYEHEGWKIDFFPIPKSNKARGKPGVRPIGVQFHGVRVLETRDALRDAVLEKAGRYGELTQPFVVAVNALSDHVDDTDAVEGLFGYEQLIYKLGGGPSQQPEFGRAPNGAWYGPKGPQNTRVSGVLVFEQLSQSNVPRAGHCLYCNPWAAKPYQGELRRLRRAEPTEEGRLKYTDGEPLSRIFDLPAGWPGD